MKAGIFGRCHDWAKPTDSKLPEVPTLSYLSLNLQHPAWAWYRGGTQEMFVRPNGALAGPESGRGLQKGKEGR